MGRHAETEEMPIHRHRSPDPINPRTPKRIAAMILVCLALVIMAVWAALSTAPRVESQASEALPTMTAHARGVRTFPTLPSLSVGALSTPVIGPTSFPNDDVLGPDPLEGPPLRPPNAGPQTVAETSRPAAPVVTRTSSPAASQSSSAPSTASSSSSSSATGGTIVLPTLTSPSLAPTETGTPSTSESVPETSEAISQPE